MGDKGQVWDLHGSARSFGGNETLYGASFRAASSGRAPTVPWVWEEDGAGRELI